MLDIRQMKQVADQFGVVARFGGELLMQNFFDGVRGQLGAEPERVIEMILDEEIYGGVFELAMLFKEIELTHEFIEKGRALENNAERPTEELFAR